MRVRSTFSQAMLHFCSAFAILLFSRSCVQSESVAEYDFVIVGGGTAGSLVAKRLVDNSQHKVLVIEAGYEVSSESDLPALFPQTVKSRYDWNYTSEALSLDNQIEIPAWDLTSGRALGGGSSIGHLMYVRGCPGDFNTWATISQSHLWRYSNVLPYFIRSEALKDPIILASNTRIFHGTQGFLGIIRENRTIVDNYLRAFEQIGNRVVLDVNGFNPFGYTKQLYTISDGMRQSTAHLLQDKRPNLTVMTNALVTKIILDENNKAVGVTVLKEDDSVLTVLASKEVILSAGAFNTPKLLMLSGIGPKQHLESLNIPVKVDLPVGQNLQDHIILPVAFKMEHSSEPLAPADPHVFPIPMFSGYVALRRFSACPEYQSVNMAASQNSSDPVTLCIALGYDSGSCQLLRVEGRNILLTILSQTQPKSRGNVSLSSADPRNAPAINLGTYSVESDMNDVLDYIEDYTRVLNSTYFRQIGAELLNFGLTNCDGYELGSRDYWKCYVPIMTRTMYHYLGTCSMGSVVDAQGRVFNTQALRVIDASIMPTQISGNIMASVLMVAEVISERILNQYR